LDVAQILQFCALAAAGMARGRTGCRWPLTRQPSSAPARPMACWRRKLGLDPGHLIKSGIPVMVTTSAPRRRI